MRTAQRRLQGEAAAIGLAHRATRDIAAGVANPPARLVLLNELVRELRAFTHCRSLDGNTLGPQLIAATTSHAMNNQNRMH